jgi:hypothetical protein
MCFNYKASLLTFFIGVVFSLLLIVNGNVKYRLENKTTGVFMIFISLIQFMDFLFWIDLKNKFGINHVTTILGPILNVCQPVIFYLIKLFYYRPELKKMQTYDIFVGLLNILYLFYFIKIYSKFISKEKLTTTVKNGHLSWPWIKYSNPYFYLILLAINIFYLSDFKYALVFFAITYSFLYLSMKYFHYNVGELWCFFGAFIPLLMFIIMRGGLVL